MAESVFNCRMCGHCCEGKGGIIVSPTDLVRISAFLQITSEEFIERYGMMHNGKLKIRSGADDYCVFFVPNKGCSVHEGKPNICRAWPFFRGNIEDPESLELAKEYCPGIISTASHSDFAAEGRRYLREAKLIATDPTCEANALILPPE
jgi:Fe-S-cluster containining protein